MESNGDQAARVNGEMLAHPLVKVHLGYCQGTQSENIDGHLSVVSSECTVEYCSDRFTIPILSE